VNNKSVFNFGIVGIPYTSRMGHHQRECARTPPEASNFKKTASSSRFQQVFTAARRRRGTADVIAKISFSRQKIKHGAVMRILTVFGRVWDLNLMERTVNSEYSMSHYTIDRYGTSTLLPVPYTRDSKFSFLCCSHRKALAMLRYSHNTNLKILKIAYFQFIHHRIEGAAK
jgi:hypothetical protein